MLKAGIIRAYRGIRWVQPRGHHSHKSWLARVPLYISTHTDHKSASKGRDHDCQRGGKNGIYSFATTRGKKYHKKEGTASPRPKFEQKNGAASLSHSTKERNLRLSFLIQLMSFTFFFLLLSYKLSCLMSFGLFISTSASWPIKGSTDRQAER